MHYEACSLCYARYENGSQLSDMGMAMVTLLVPASNPQSSVSYLGEVATYRLIFATCTCGIPPPASSLPFSSASSSSCPWLLSLVRGWVWVFRTRFTDRFGAGFLSSLSVSRRDKADLFGGCCLLCAAFPLAALVLLLGGMAMRIDGS